MNFSLSAYLEVYSGEELTILFGLIFTVEFVVTIIVYKIIADKRIAETIAKTNKKIKETVARKIIEVGCSFSYDVRIRIDEVHEGKEQELREELISKLNEYCELTEVKNLSSFILKNVSVSFFEIDRVLSTIESQPLERKNIKISIDYTSVQAEGSININIVIKASPESTVSLKGYDYSWKVDQSGLIEETVNIKKDDLVRGYIDGYVRKGNLEDNMRINLKL